MKTAKTYLVAGFFFTAVLGTLAHFFYEWSGENPLAGLFTPVSESTWEHMKLVFFPVLLWSFFLPPRLAAEHPALRPAVLLGGIGGTFLIPVLFYTCSGILGRTVTWVDIAIFYISSGSVFLWTWKLHLSETRSAVIKKRRAAVFLLTALLVLLFFLFTFLPPDIGLFAAP